MELVLLDGLFSEGDNLLFGLSLILWKGHPLADDFAARLVVFFHDRVSLAYFSERRPSPRPNPPGNINTTFAPIRRIALLQLWGLAAPCLGASRPFPEPLFIGSRRAWDHG
jgi:hypothetical protein